VEDERKMKFIFLDNNFVPQRAPEIDNSHNDGSLKALLNKFTGSVVNKVVEHEERKDDSDNNETESSHSDEEESQLSEEDYQDSNYNHFLSNKNEMEDLPDLNADEDYGDEANINQQSKSGKKERRKVECEVFAENIPLDKHEKEIIKIFKNQNTKIVKIKVLKDKETGKSKGKAFIKFFTAEDANQFLNSKLKIEKNKITLSIVKKFEEIEKCDGEKNINPKNNNNPKNSKNSNSKKSLDSAKNEKNTLHTAFIRNLPLILEEDTVKKTFKKFGKIANIRLIKTKEGKSKGFGYIDFETEADLEKVLKNEEAFTLGGKEIHIEKAKSSFSDKVYETGKRLGKKKKRENTKPEEEEN
jgi:RNA recognition motif-containing protein